MAHWKKDMICPVCGITFKGTVKAVVCGATCRTRLKRILKEGKRPEFLLVAKGRGQKLPLFFAQPKSKQEKKEESNDTKINYRPATEKSFDAPKISKITMDEVGQWETPKELTLSEKMAHNAEIERRIAEEKRKSSTPGVHPRLWKLQQDDIIAELKKQLK